jgi:phosphoglycerol transferase MdoB-like AlkP superfamily enzyme
MKPTIKAGIALGILVGLWTLLMGVTGWYKNPAMVNVFYVVILIEIGVLVWGLKKTGPESSYWQQVWNGIFIAILGSVIIFFVSFFFTSVLYPNYFADLQTIQEETLRSQGKTDAEISAMVEAGKPMATSAVNAIMGVVGTVATGAIASLVIGAFYRKKH